MYKFVMIHHRGLSVPYACAHVRPNRNFNKHLKQGLNSCAWLLVSKVMRVREITTLNQEVK